MRIYIDADGCPVVDSTLRLAAAHRVETVILWISPWSTDWPRGMW